MLKRYHRVIGGLFRLVDACVIGVVWLASYYFRFEIPLIAVTKDVPSFASYAALTPLVMIVWAFVFSATGVYRGGRMLRRTHEAHLMLKAHGVALLFFIALTYLISDYKISRGVMILFGSFGAFGLVAFRLTLRNLLRHYRSKGFNLRYVVAVGEGKPLGTLIARMDKFPELGLRVIGVVTHEQQAATTLFGKPVLGHFGELGQIVDSQPVDQVLIALPSHQYQDMDRLLRTLADATVGIQIVPDIHEYVTLGCEVEDFDGLPIVNLNDSPLNGWGAIIKRLTDFLLAAVALLILSPVFLLLALLVKLTSSGPIFFRQERMGLDGRTFAMFKFRSMRTDAEVSTGAVWAVKNDQRRTGLGSFIRSTSLDELPQFWNVLRGDMSLVGPRPERPVFVQQFRKDVPHYMLRHKVKAGITGWAQVNGWRGDTSLDRRIECDLYYIRNWSYLLDWKILFLTIWKGFVNKNAY